MKSPLFPTLFTLLIFSPFSWGQTPSFTYADFEAQFMVFEPQQPSTVSAKDFEFAEMVIRETKSAVAQDVDGFNIADYWNIATAFARLQAPERDLELVWQKILAAESHCEYLIELQPHSPLDDIFPEAYARQVALCRGEAAQKTPQPFDLNAYAQEHQLDVALLRRMQQMEQNDQRFRSTQQGVSRQQALLDRQNQQQVEALYQEYGTYMGRSLVGDQFMATMWQVIQHSNLAMMERYLPVIHGAVQEGELGVVPLKMLVDRIYAIKHNYQIFGSQQGVPMASTAIQEQVRRTFFGE